jgi:hypothetical protein
MPVLPTSLNLSTGVRLELRQRPDGRFAGLGAVVCDGTPLRGPRLHHVCELRTPDGWQLGGWQTLSVVDRQEGVDVVLRPTRRRGVPMEWMVHTVRSRQPLPEDLEDGDAHSDGELTLELRAVERSVVGERLRGFSYRWRWRSERTAIYRILDRGSWEPGGTVIGNEFWQRGSFAPPIARFTSASDAYSSEWYMPGIANPNIFQFLPLQTHLQGFTMTVGAAGSLLTWGPQVAHIRSLFEKQAGHDEMLHVHELCGDLAACFDAPPIEVLWAPGARDRTANANLYEAFRELVADTLHPQIGMEREYARSYCRAEEWEDADLPRYASSAVPKAAAANAEIIGLANHFAHNMNVYGVSNMCCTLDYQWPDAAIRSGMQAVGAAARAHGMQVQMWGNTSLSSLTHMLAIRSGRPKRIDFWEAPGGGILPVLKRAKDPWVHNSTGGFENDHYNPAFLLLNLADPDIRAYWHERWKAAHDEVGLTGMFLDSAFNLSSDKFSFSYNASGSGGGATIDNVGALGRARPASEPPSSIRSLYLPYLTLMAEMQRYGVRFCGEDLGVFGTHRTGPSVTAKLDNLFMWNEVYAYWDGAAVAKAGHNPADIFFQGLAFRQPWELQWNPHDDTIWLNPGHERPAAAHIALFGAFNRVNDRMRNRTILPGGGGVLYRPAPGEWVLWAFSDGVLPRQPGQQVVDVLSGAVLAPGESIARRNRVYHARRLPG